MARRAKPQKLVARMVMPDRVRMNVRIPPLVASFIASALAPGESLSGFIVNAAVDRTHRVLRDLARHRDILEQVGGHQKPSHREINPQARIDMRVPATVRAYIIDGATRELESLTSYVIRAAVERAGEVVRDPVQYAAAVEAVRRLPYSRW